MDEKIIYLDIEEDDMYSGMEAISFVEDPATQVDWFKFARDKKDKQSFVKNDVKRIVTCPVMLAETPIYRYSEEMGEYYVKFSADMIHRMRNKYIMEGRQNSVNEDHDSKKKVKDVFMVESYIVGDKVKSELYPDLPEGTWVASFYIDDVNYWNNKILSDKFNGFSLEGFFIENYEMNLQASKEDDFIKQVENIIQSDYHDLVKHIHLRKLVGLD